MAQNSAHARARSGKSGAPTTADLIVMSLLNERAMHGYQVINEYERQEVADWASVSKAQVYYALKKLAALGLIAEEPDGADGGDDARPKTVFAVTDAGREALSSALSDPAWGRTRIAAPFTTWVGLSIDLPTSSALAVIEARRLFLEEELSRERKSLDFVRTLTAPRARVGEAVIKLQIQHLEAELVWLDDLTHQVVAAKATSDPPPDR